MKQMNKELEYKGYKFNIQVTINLLRHDIEVTDEIFPVYYTRRYSAEDWELESVIKRAEQNLYDYIDSFLEGKKVEDRLTELGFIPL